MAIINQNLAWNWLSNSKTGKHSLKRGLLIRVGGVFFATWIISAIYTKFYAYNETRELLTSQAQSMAENLISLLEGQNFSNVTLPTQETQILLGWKAQTLVLKQGDMIFPQPSEQKNYVQKIEGIAWVISSQCKKENCILVALRDSERKHVVRRMVALIFLPLLVVMSLAMLAMHMAIRSGLMPLNRLANKVSATSVEDLLPFNEEESVQELKPLIRGLNQFMYKMKEQLLRERQFLDTCAHELRTPVAGLVSQIQSLNKPDDPQLENIYMAGHRTVRVANQFLSLAKVINAEALSDREEKFDLCELIRHSLADLLVDKVGVECEMHGESSLMVKADAWSLEIICRNLIENAIHYGRSNQSDTIHIIFSVLRDGHMTTLIVEDSGPGVSQSDKEHLLTRFYRADNKTGNTDGAGLGLSIVNEVANRYGGSVTIDMSAELGGLKVEVNLSGIARQD